MTFLIQRIYIYNVEKELQSLAYIFNSSFAIIWCFFMDYQFDIEYFYLYQSLPIIPAKIVCYKS